ncbi:hypothetical protein FBU59_000775 [Linderina macrospora]|uniref:Uncharacterized protein n=1 Tax=Linderina macrospora TaxID=4868 RepID=A0ACC1JFZ9_9FUNG|nr:hypothetical protein FBU59_000775 [Linderina macrospora]
MSTVTQSQDMSAGELTLLQQIERVEAAKQLHQRTSAQALEKLETGRRVHGEERAMVDAKWELCRKETAESIGESKKNWDHEQLVLDQLHQRVHQKVCELFPGYDRMMDNMVKGEGAARGPTMAEVVAGQPAQQAAEEPPNDQAVPTERELRKLLPKKKSIGWTMAKSAKPKDLTVEEKGLAKEVFAEPPEWSVQGDKTVVCVASIKNTPARPMTKKQYQKANPGRYSEIRSRIASVLPYAMRVYNISKPTDMAAELVVNVENYSEVCYRLHQANWAIIATPEPVYMAPASEHAKEPREETTLSRWAYDSTDSKSPEAREYYSALLETHGQKAGGQAKSLVSDKESAGEWSEKEMCESEEALEALFDDAAWKLADTQNRKRRAPSSLISRGPATRGRRNSFEALTALAGASSGENQGEQGDAEMGIMPELEDNTRGSTANAEASTTPPGVMRC